LRVWVQLIEAKSGSYLWGERVDGEVGGFEIQDRVAALVATNLKTVLEGEHANAARHRPFDSPLDELCSRALQASYSYDAASLFKAHNLLTEAIERNPDNATALAAAAGCRHFLDCAGWSPGDGEKNHLAAVGLAHQALKADGNTPAVLAEAARTLAYFTGDI